MSDSLVGKKSWHLATKSLLLHRSLVAKFFPQLGSGPRWCVAPQIAWSQFTLSTKSCRAETKLKVPFAPLGAVEQT
eukprot:scaffold218051_cov44-Prasinocladus_malaysianus.AAC.1